MSYSGPIAHDMLPANCTCHAAGQLNMSCSGPIYQVRLLHTSLQMAGPLSRAKLIQRHRWKLTSSIDLLCKGALFRDNFHYGIHLINDRGSSRGGARYSYFWEGNHTCTFNNLYHNSTLLLTRRITNQNYCKHSQRDQRKKITQESDKIGFLNRFKLYYMKSDNSEVDVFDGFNEKRWNNTTIFKMNKTPLRLIVTCQYLTILA